MLRKEFPREIVIAQIATLKHLDEWAQLGFIKELFEPNGFNSTGNSLKISMHRYVRDSAVIIRQF